MKEHFSILWIWFLVKIDRAGRHVRRFFDGLEPFGFIALTYAALVLVIVLFKYG